MTLVDLGCNVYWSFTTEDFDDYTVDIAPHGVGTDSVTQCGRHNHARVQRFTLSCRPHHWIEPPCHPHTTRAVGLRFTLRSMYAERQTCGYDVLWQVSCDWLITLSTAVDDIQCVRMRGRFKNLALSTTVDGIRTSDYVIDNDVSLCMCHQGVRILSTMLEHLAMLDFWDHPLHSHVYDVVSSIILCPTYSFGQILRWRCRCQLLFLD